MRSIDAMDAWLLWMHGYYARTPSSKGDKKPGCPPMRISQLRRIKFEFEILMNKQCVNFFVTFAYHDICLGSCKTTSFCYGILTFCRYKKTEERQGGQFQKTSIGGGCIE